MTRDDRPLGNVADKLLFEDELVREAMALVERVSRPLADSAAAARVLDLPPVPGRGSL